LVEIIVDAVYNRGCAAFSAGFFGAVAGGVVLEYDRLQRGVALGDGVAGKAVVMGVFVVNVPGFIASCFGFVCDVARVIVGEGVCYEDVVVVVFGGLGEDAARIVVREGGDGTGLGDGVNIPFIGVGVGGKGVVAAVNDFVEESTLVVLVADGGAKVVGDGVDLAARVVGVVNGFAVFEGAGRQAVQAVVGVALRAVVNRRTVLRGESAHTFTNSGQKETGRWTGSVKRSGTVPVQAIVYA